MRSATNVDKLRQFMREIGKAVTSPGRVYFTGGASAVLLGWRDTTLDIDLKADPEPSGFFEALPKLKDRIDINIELASPEDFVPALPAWRDRSVRIEAVGNIEFFHYDFYGQALSKIERLYERDEFDVARMVQTKLVQPKQLWELFRSIEDRIIRYPAVDADILRGRVQRLVEAGVL